MSDRFVVHVPVLFFFKYNTTVECIRWNIWMSLGITVRDVKENSVP